MAPNCRWQPHSRALLLAALLTPVAPAVHTAEEPPGNATPFCSRAELTPPNECHLSDGRACFTLQATAGSSLNTLSIAPLRLQRPDQDIVMEIDGTAYRAELADLDQDGWPEVYVYVSSAGSGSYGSLAAFAVNQGQTLEPIQLPPLAATPEAATGYQGHDEFRIVNGELLRRFPVYNETDTNAAPGGAVRQLHYHLHREDAKWQLRTVRVTTNDETAAGSWPH